jgi:type VI protein secretion system component VasF
LDQAAPPTVSALTEFYREEFVKHHKCLQAQREYFSAQAIQNAENALLKIIADLDRLTEEANAEHVVARLLREFDVVTGLSGWSDNCKVN